MPRLREREIEPHDVVQAPTERATDTASLGPG